MPLVAQATRVTFTRGRSAWRTIRGVALCVGIVFLCTGSACERYRATSNNASLTRILEGEQEASPEKLAALCREIGPPAAAKVRQAAISTRDPNDRKRFLRALLLYDTNGYLEFAVELVAEFPEERMSLLAALKGQLDCESRAKVRSLVDSTSGSRRAASIRTFALVCDDEETLGFLKTQLQAPTEDQEVVLALISTLGHCAYYANDTTVVENFRPFLKSPNKKLRFLALFSLSSVPGASAERVFLDTVRTSPDGYTEQFISNALSARKEALAIAPGDRIAPGWRDAATRSSCRGTAPTQNRNPPQD